MNNCSDNFHKIILYVNNTKSFYNFPKNISKKIDNHYKSDCDSKSDSKKSDCKSKSKSNKSNNNNQVKEFFKLHITPEKKLFLKVFEKQSNNILKNDPTLKYLESLIEFITDLELNEYSLFSSYLESHIHILNPIKKKLLFFFKPIIIGSLIRVLCRTNGTIKDNEYMGIDIKNMKCKLHYQIKYIIDNNIKIIPGEKKDYFVKEFLFGIMGKINKDEISKKIINPLDIYVNCKCMFDDKDLCKNHWIIILDKNNQSNIQLFSSKILIKDYFFNKDFEKRKIINKSTVLVVPEYTYNKYSYCYGTSSKSSDYIHMFGFNIETKNNKKIIINKKNEHINFNLTNFPYNNKINKLDLNSISPNAKNFYDENGCCWLHRIFNNDLFGEFKQFECVLKTKNSDNSLDNKNHSLNDNSLNNNNFDPLDDKNYSLENNLNDNSLDSNKYLTNNTSSKYYWIVFNDDKTNCYLVVFFNNGYCFHEIDISKNILKYDLLPKCNRVVFDNIYFDVDKVIKLDFNLKYNGIAFTIGENLQELFFTKNNTVNTFNSLLYIDEFEYKNIKLLEIDFKYSIDGNYLIIANKIQFINNRKSLQLSVIDYKTFDCVLNKNLAYFIDLISITDLTCIFLL